MPDTFDDYWNRGLEMYNAGKFEEAIKEWREASRFDPEDGYVLHSIANALSKLGRDEAAITEWQAAVRLEPDYASPHTSLAYALARVERHQEALVAIRDALRLSPESADLYALQGHQLYTMASASDDKNTFLMALASLQRAWQIRPDDAYALYRLGVVEWRLGQKRRAIETLKASIQLDPTDVEVLITLYEFQSSAFQARGLWQTICHINSLPASEKLEHHSERIIHLSRRGEFDLGLGIGFAAAIAVLWYWKRRQR